MILHRIEATLDMEQPEEQHGFRAGWRMKEHVLTTNLILDKSTRFNLPIWIVSLDLSKAFDRVHWPALWRTLRRQGVSDHVAWLLETLYADQRGQVMGQSNDVSDDFDISASVRQGCVLSPRLFCAVLREAMRSWRYAEERNGLNVQDGLQHLLDLRFADDILLFAETSHR